MHAHHHLDSNMVWYGWQAWDFSSLLLMFFMIGFYIYANSRWQSVRVKHKVAFGFAMLTYFIAMVSPMQYLGHHALFSMHMTQQSLMYMVFPPLVLLGIPTEWYAGWMKRPKVDRLFRFLTKPLVTVLGFNALFSLYHIPVVFDTAMQSNWLHIVYHSVLLLTAFQMWWSMLTPIPEQSSLSDLKRVAFIFSNGVILTPACALIVFANQVLYNTYIDVDPTLAWLPPLSDQQAGGVIMKIVQELAYGITLTVTFFAWYRKERKVGTDELTAEELAMLNQNK